MFFNTEKKAKELGIRADIYHKLEEEIKNEFPHDEMMVELHLLRVLIEYSRKKVEN